MQWTERLWRGFSPGAAVFLFQLSSVSCPCPAVFHLGNGRLAVRRCCCKMKIFGSARRYNICPVTSARDQPYLSDKIIWYTCCPFLAHGRQYRLILKVRVSHLIHLLRKPKETWLSVSNIQRISDTIVHYIHIRRYEGLKGKLHNCNASIHVYFNEQCLKSSIRRS
jgi:hypothetical protein